MNSFFSEQSQDPFHRFRAKLAEKNLQHESQRQIEAETTEKKDRDLVPIRKLLQQIVEMNIQVSNASRWAGGTRPTDLSPKPFKVSEDKSSDPYLPGNSIYIDHPAELEIAVPNPVDLEEKGVVVILCATDNPHRSMLNGPFRTMEEACTALADFIAENTEHAILD
jgi:hypothetical protein